jgi:starvation-inducible DNA-binding protein
MPAQTFRGSKKTLYLVMRSAAVSDKLATSGLRDQKRRTLMKATETVTRKRHEQAAWGVASDLGRDAVAAISNNLRQLLADVFALYMKTKNFHWHMTGRHFRDYHLLLDEQAEQLFAMTDDIAERARKLGGTTLHSISDIAGHQRLKDNNEQTVDPNDMLAELTLDNGELVRFMRESHELCAQYNDVATTSLIEVWIDQSERRVWFLSEVAVEE